MFLFGLAAVAEFFNKEIHIGSSVMFKYWHVILVIIAILALMALLIVVCVRADKKGKRRYEETSEAIDVSSKTEETETATAAERDAEPEYEKPVAAEEEKTDEEEKEEAVIEKQPEETAVEEKVEETVVKPEHKDETEIVAAEEPVKDETAKPIVAKKAAKKPAEQKTAEEKKERVNILEKPSVVLADPDNKVVFEEPVTDGEGKETKVVGKIEICNSDLGGYNYLLLANNGQLLYESKSYKSIDSCREAITNFIEAVKAGRFTVRADKFKNYKFILKSPTSNTLLYVGESFSTETSCRNNIESVKRFAPISPITDITTEDYVAKFVHYEIPEEVVAEVASGTGAVGKWEIAKVDENSKNSPFVFLLFANNGQLLYESRDYKAESGCINGLKTFVNTVRDGYFVIDPDKSGRFKFVLRSKSANSPIEYYGQNYDTQKACASSIESVYRFALRSPIPEKNTNK